MAMSGANFGANIFSAFTASGYIGIDSITFANAVGIGSMVQIIGKPFDTTDGPGSQAAAGVGAGTGLTLIVAAVVSLQIQAEIVAFTGLPPQSDMITMADDIADSFVTEVGLATLVTAHTPMYTGTAIITPGSIAVVNSAISDSIESAAPTFIGNDWPDFATVFGNALGDGLALASSNVITVTGAPPATPSAFPVGPNSQSPAGVLA